jgi:hypothetical protein
MTTHIIARRLLEPRRTEESGWRMLPGALMSLADARAAYDQGIIEIAQSHPGDGFVYQCGPDPQAPGARAVPTVFRTTG